MGTCTSSCNSNAWQRNYFYLLFCSKILHLSFGCSLSDGIMPQHTHMDVGKDKWDQRRERLYKLAGLHEECAGSLDCHRTPRDSAFGWAASRLSKA